MARFFKLKEFAAALVWFFMKESGSNSDWYLVYSKVRSEIKAKENLDRLGYKVYLPMINNKRRRDGRNIVTREAFFPRYLFIQLTKEMDNLRPVNSTIGVSRLVRFGETPALVPGSLIDSIMANEDQSGLQPEPTSVKLKAGDRVEVIDGLFSGSYGIYQREKGSDRVAILLDVVGKNTKVTLSAHEIKPA